MKFAQMQIERLRSWHTISIANFPSHQLVSPSRTAKRHGATCSIFFTVALVTAAFFRHHSWAHTVCAVALGAALGSGSKAAWFLGKGIAGPKG